MKTAMELIADERARRIAHGFDADHDDGHDDGGLLEAAIQIASDVHTYADDGEGYDIRGADRRSWQDQLAAKISARPAIDRLVIAATFIVAEIERLDRCDGNG